MATTTTNYGWAIPTSTDLVKDGATAIATLGSAIDTSVNTALGTKKAGMVLINTTSFTNVSSVSLPTNTFTSTYQNYLVIGYLRNTTTSSTVSLRYRAAGTDASGSNYQTQEVFAGNTVYAGSRNTTTGHLFTVCSNTFDCNFQLNLYRVQEAATTSFNSTSSRSDAVSWQANSGYHDLATSYDSLTIINSSSNFTGKVQVFGYNA
jgi:hypothetical protein